MSTLTKETVYPNPTFAWYSDMRGFDLYMGRNNIMSATRLPSGNWAAFTDKTFRFFPNEGALCDYIAKWRNRRV